MVTADEIADAGSLDLTLSVNGTVKQKANTRDLVIDIADLIVFASSFYTLHPGDVLLTGTPEGVGPVQPGDTMHVRNLERRRDGRPRRGPAASHHDSPNTASHHEGQKQTTRPDRRRRHRRTCRRACPRPDGLSGPAVRAGSRIQGDRSWYPARAQRLQDVRLARRHRRDHEIRCVPRESHHDGLRDRARGRARAARRPVPEPVRPSVRRDPSCRLSSRPAGSLPAQSADQPGDQRQDQVVRAIRRRRDPADRERRKHRRRGADRRRRAVVHDPNQSLGDGKPRVSGHIAYRAVLPTAEMPNICAGGR